MGAREWLEQVRDAASRIEPLVREVSALEDASELGTSWVPRDALGPHGRHNSSDPTAAMAQRRMAGLYGRLDDRRRELVAAQELVGAGLRLVAEVRTRFGERAALVLEVYYVDVAGTWSEVAQELGISVDTVYRERDRVVAWMDSASGVYLAASVSFTSSP